MKIHNHFIKVLAAVFILLAGISAASAKGKKYALFVGINKYEGGIKPLKGCVNDALKMRETLTSKFGFELADTTLLTDADATRENILGAIEKYQGLVKKGDVFVFHFSGHGTLFPDKYSEFQDETKMTYMSVKKDDGTTEVLYERDKYDSAIVPVDARSRTSGKEWRNLIIDDELNEAFSVFTAKGVKANLISDSCNSGSLVRAGTPVGVERRSSPLTTVFGEARFSDLKFEKPANAVAGPAPKPAGALYITMTGSKDDEFSLDAQVGDVPMGLFTSILLRRINSTGGNRLTYERLWKDLAPEVATAAKAYENNQNPQLVTVGTSFKTVIFGFPRLKGRSPGRRSYHGRK